MNLLSILALVAVLGVAPQGSPTPSATVAPSPSASAPAPGASSAAPVASASAVPVAPAPASAAAAPKPAVATTSPDFYKFRFVPRQPEHPAPGKPQIFAVYLNDQTLHSQGPIQIKVQTGNDVVKVVSQNSGHQGIIPQIVPGDFEAFSTLPKVPFIASGMTLYLEFVATGPTGATTSVRVPVKLI